MDRRQFLALAIASPTTALVAPVSAIEALANIDLKIRKGRHPDDSFFAGQNYYEISKGEHTVICGFSAGQDLRDYHNLCATHELFMVVVEQLEIGRDRLVEHYSTVSTIDPFNNQPRLPPKVYTLTKNERARLYKLMVELRGPHNCVCRKT